MSPTGSNVNMAAEQAPGTNVTGAGRGFTAEELAQLEADAAVVTARYPEARSALLPLLHLVQSVEGFVSPAGIEFCARVLGQTTAEVSAVATFYTMYKRRPVGDYHVGVCTNTLCAVMGGDAIFDSLKDHLDVGNDETTADGKLTLEHIECNAACDFAPVMMVNWEFFDNQTVESAKELVDALRSGADVRSTRGPRVPRFTENERLLAGFYDGLADAGPTAGPASLAGLRLAEDEEENQQRGGTTRPGGTSVSDGSARSKGSAGDTTPGLATGYGHARGPSGDDAGVSTAKSDPARSQTPERAGDAAGPGGPPGGTTATTDDPTSKGKG